MDKFDSIYIAGHTGLVGSALVRLLTKEGYTNLVCRDSSQLDLTNQSAVEDFFKKEHPSYVFLAAAKVGGIKANSELPAEFITRNLQIQTNIIHSAWKYGVKKLIFPSCCCVYPYLSPQPMRVGYLLTGPFEPTNEAFAAAKIAGMIMCQSYFRQYGCRFISCIGANLYGPNDDLDLAGSHFLPAIIQKFHQAKIDKCPNAQLWGTGSARRELLHVDDFAQALVFLMDKYNSFEFINVGTDEDYSIKEIALMVKQVVGYEGDLIFDTSKPDGMPRKALDSAILRGLGWKPEINLVDGIAQVYEDIKNHLGS